MNFQKIFVWISISLCSACAVTAGAPYKRNFCSSAGMGGATFYQEPGFAGSGLHPLLKVDGVEIAPVPKGGFVAVRLTEGEHEFELVDNKNDMAAWGKSEDLRGKFSIKNGEEKLFKFYVRNWSPALPIPVGAVFIPVGGSRKSAAIDIPYAQASEIIDGLKGSFYSLDESATELNPDSCQDQENQR